MLECRSVCARVYVSECAERAMKITYTPRTRTCVVTRNTKAEDVQAETVPNLVGFLPECVTCVKAISDMHHGGTRVMKC
jgi:hypothetical protein